MSFPAPGILPFTSSIFSDIIAICDSLEKVEVRDFLVMDVNPKGNVDRKLIKGSCRDDYVRR